MDGESPILFQPYWSQVVSDTRKIPVHIYVVLKPKSKLYIGEGHGMNYKYETPLEI